MSEPLTPEERAKLKKRAANGARFVGYGLALRLIADVERLERERNEARAEAGRAHEAAETLRRDLIRAKGRLERERDEARDQLETLQANYRNVLGFRIGEQPPPSLWGWRPVPADMAAELAAADAAGCELRVALWGQPRLSMAFRRVHRDAQDRIYAVRWQPREPSLPAPPSEGAANG